MSLQLALSDYGSLVQQVMATAKRLMGMDGDLLMGQMCDHQLASKLPIPKAGFCPNRESASDHRAGGR